MEIAILDDDGVIIGVQQCSEDDFKTDSVRKTVQLDDSHDMHLRLRAYKYDFNRNCFLPLSTEPVEHSDRNVPELVDGIIDAIEDINDHFKYLEIPDDPDDPKPVKKFKLSRKSRRALKRYRRISPRPGREPEDDAS